MPIDDLTALGQKMREVRKNKELTQQELSDLSHVSVKQIANIEVSLQVVIGLCKRKETAALKIKAAVPNGRVTLYALRRLFFFYRRPAECYSMFISIFPVKSSHSIPI